MNDEHNYSCTICGEENSAPNGWFLVTQNQLEDKLRILAWNDWLAIQCGVQCVCGPTHAQELVVHWMATGNIDHPFARMASSGVRTRRWGDGFQPSCNLGTLEVKAIGELSVHRDSMRQLLSENPGSLKSVLDALSMALQSEIADELPKKPQRVADYPKVLSNWQDAS